MVLERGLVVGGHRGCAVIVHGPRGALASQLNAGVRWTQGRPRRTRRTRPVRRAEGTRGVLLEQCMDVRAERWLAPHAGESKGRTAPHGTGGNVSGAVRPLHALGVERQLRAPAGPRERGTCGSVAARARATRGVSVVPPNKAMKLTKLSAALWHGRHEELVGRCRLVPAVAWLRAGTASQLIASVRRTRGARWRSEARRASGEARGSGHVDR